MVRACVAAYTQHILTHKLDLMPDTHTMLSIQEARGMTFEVELEEEGVRDSQCLK